MKENDKYFDQLWQDTKAAVKYLNATLFLFYRHFMMLLGHLLNADE